MKLWNLKGKITDVIKLENSTIIIDDTDLKKMYFRDRFYTPADGLDFLVVLYLSLKMSTAVLVEFDNEEEENMVLERANTI